MIPTTDFTDPATIRLISTAYIKEEAVAPLADDDEEIEILTKLEGSTSARISTVALPADVDPSEILKASYGYGYTLINAAFCHARPPGNRFNSQDRGAWYCAFGIDAKLTSQAEIIFHRTRALTAVGCFDDIGHYRELLAGFTSSFHDLRSMPDHASLQTDPAIAYPVGQTLAKSIFASGGNGLIYPSVRRPGGGCIAVFRPSVIQNVRQGDHITFKWDGSAIPSILQTP
ncbi:MULTISPECIES: RES family NAD+ phosphorylase [Brucella/Ochrobactrum group]|uniref:RES family NAD+ phosphorylase n=1 Tax=Brucella anthropi TaxID=529 RepID=A0A6L3ZAX4_BRUAN|nr:MULTISPECIES: RES family NAD+ phosphorylase [Brucella/Ochrobactrum group]KAB2773218.1 RES family NAD+ phosphorylase [Brucella anthropi]